MEFPLISRLPNPGTTAFSCCCRVGVSDFPVSLQRRKSKKKWAARKVGGFKVVAERSGEGIDGGERKSGGGGGGYTRSAMEVSTFNQNFGDAELPVWEKIGAVVRLIYGIGIYGAMALAGRFVCSFTGTDCMGGFEPSLDAIVEGLVYASPPIMALLFILDDEIVKVSPHARAIRDVEDEELRSFFYGMSPWQFILIVAASSVGEELFYRAAVQGALADIILRGTDFVTDARGMASFTAWYERRQMKKIYSPLLEGFLALYLGFVWIQTNNILAPIITHGIYSTVILGHGLWKMHDHRKRLRQRIQQVKLEGKESKL